MRRRTKSTKPPPLLSTSPSPRDLTPEQLEAEFDRLRERRREADRDASYLQVWQWRHAEER